MQRGEKDLEEKDAVVVELQAENKKLQNTQDHLLSLLEEHKKQYDLLFQFNKLKKVPNIYCKHFGGIKNCNSSCGGDILDATKCNR